MPSYVSANKAEMNRKRYQTKTGHGEGTRASRSVTTNGGANIVAHRILIETKAKNKRHAEESPRSGTERERKK